MCVALGDPAVAAWIYIAAVAAWTITTFGAALCDSEASSRESASRSVAIACALLVLTPFLPAVAALLLTIALGVHAIFTAITRVPEVLRPVERQSLSDHR